jgi:hypothetical protein
LVTLPEPLEGDAPLDEPLDDEPRDTDPDRVEDFEPEDIFVPEDDEDEVPFREVYPSPENCLKIRPMDESRQGLSPFLVYRLPEILMDEGYPAMPRANAALSP